MNGNGTNGNLSLYSWASDWTWEKSLALFPKELLHYTLSTAPHFSET